VVEAFEQARQIPFYYGQRWACEEAGRFLKNRLGLECFRIRNYEAIKGLVTPAMLAMGLLTLMLLRSKQLPDRFFRFTSCFRRKTKFIYYRLLDGLQEFARLYEPRFGQIPLKPLKNG